MFVEIWIFHQLSWLDSSPPRCDAPVCSLQLFTIYENPLLSCCCLCGIWNWNSVKPSISLTWKTFCVRRIWTNWIKLSWNHHGMETCTQQWSRATKTKRTKMNKCSTIWKEFITVEMPTASSTWCSQTLCIQTMMRWTNSIENYVFFKALYADDELRFNFLLEYDEQWENLLNFLILPLVSPAATCVMCVWNLRHSRDGWKFFAEITRHDSIESFNKIWAEFRFYFLFSTSL